MGRFYLASTLPLPGDVIWCNFPLRELPGKPGPKARPSLVRGVGRSLDGLRGLVEASFGTSKIIGNPPDSLIISDAAELAACGLARPTCFHLDQTVVLPWSEDYFAREPLSSKLVIGHLPPSAKIRLTAATRR